MICPLKYTPIIEKEFLARLYSSFSENPNSMVSVHHHYFRVAIGINGMVGKPNLVAFPSSVHHEIWKKKLGQMF